MRGRHIGETVIVPRICCVFRHVTRAGILR
jgi:hypothetical protein